MKLKIQHTSEYFYDEPVSYALQQVRLTPSNGPTQKTLDWQVEIEGGVVELSFQDQHKNHTMLVSADPGVEVVRITASGEVETIDVSGVFGRVYDTAPLWYFQQHTERTKPGKGTAKLSKIIGKTSSQLDDLHSLSRAVLTAAPYGKGSTFVGTTAEEALSSGGGVCQDHAQIFVTAARLAGIPARYVSGYLMLDDTVDQEASHAWAEAHLEGLGWVGFDVSNCISPDERYVRLATGLDSRDAAPISGMRLGRSNETMIVSLQIQQ